MATAGSNNLADNASFHQNTAGFTRHMNLDDSNPFYTDAVDGLTVDSIALGSSGDKVEVTFDSGDDLSKVMKFAKLVLVNTVNGANDVTFEIASVNDTTKVVECYFPKNYRFTAQAGVGGVGNVIPLQGANFIQALEDSTTFSSLVEKDDFISGDEDKLQGLTWGKDSFQFGYFTEIVVTAGSVRIALL